MADKKLDFIMTEKVAADMDNDQQFACEVANIIFRFTCNDWGEINSDDYFANKSALKQGGSVHGTYTTQNGTVCAITKDALANPKVTTIMYIEEL